MAETHWHNWAFLLRSPYRLHTQLHRNHIGKDNSIISNHIYSRKNFVGAAIDSLDEELDNVNLLAQGLEQPYLEYALDSMTLVLETLPLTDLFAYWCT